MMQMQDDNKKQIRVKRLVTGEIVGEAIEPDDVRRPAIKVDRLGFIQRGD